MNAVNLEQHMGWVGDLALGHGRYQRTHYIARLLLGFAFLFIIAGTMLSCLWIFFLAPMPFALIFLGFTLAVMAYLWCFTERVARIWRLSFDGPLED